MIINKGKVEELAKAVCNGCKTRHKCDNECCTMSYVVAEYLIENGFGNIKTELRAFLDYIENRNKEITPINYHLITVNHLEYVFKELYGE